MLTYIWWITLFKHLYSLICDNGMHRTYCLCKAMKKVKSTQASISIIYCTESAKTVLPFGHRYFSFTSSKIIKYFFYKKEQLLTKCCLNIMIHEWGVSFLPFNSCSSRNARNFFRNIYILTKDISFLLDFFWKLINWNNNK